MILNQNLAFPVCVGYPGLSVVRVLGSDVVKSDWFLLLMCLCICSSLSLALVGLLSLTGVCPSCAPVNL